MVTMSKLRKSLRNMLLGAGSVFDLMPAPLPPLKDRIQSYDPNLTPDQQDAQAIRGDWERVGQYISDAMIEVEREIEDSKQKQPYSSD